MEFIRIGEKLIDRNRIDGAIETCCESLEGGSQHKRPTEWASTGRSCRASRPR